MKLLIFIITFSIIVIILSLYQIFFEEKIKLYFLKFKNIYQKKGGVEFVRIIIKKDRIDYQSIDHYFNLTNTYISEAKKSIKVVDYLSSHNVIKGLYEDSSRYSDEHAKYLIKKYDEYYNNLKNVVIKNKNLEYTRISQISGMYRKENLEPKDAVKKAVGLMTPSLILHLLDMLGTFNSKAQKRFKFFVCKAPAVLYNYVIIDDKFILSEYPFYNPEGVTFPDEMYVNRISSLSAQLKKRSKLFDVLKSKKDPIDYDLMRNSYTEISKLDLEEDVNEKYKESYKKIDLKLEEKTN